MFREACVQYFPVLCGFGGGDDQAKRKLHAFGCLLSPKHVLTAAHCVDLAASKYAYPLVSKFDGLFRCELQFSDATLDVAILEAATCLESANQIMPRAFPEYAPKKLQFGMQIGYVTRLNKHDDAGCTMFYNYFGCGYTAFLGHTNGTPHWVLSNGLIESGFSGSPAFTADGTLVGVVTGVSCIETVIDGMHPLPVRYPQISPLPEIPSGLSLAIQSAKS